MKSCYCLILLLLVFVSCATTYEINTACDKISETQYNIKWETDPGLNGDVKIYVSDDVKDFDKTKPLLTIPVDYNMAFLDFSDLMPRPYFLMQFNDNYECIVSERHIQFERIGNFRDLGGYHGHKGKQIKWGKLYRTGTLDSMSLSDAEKLKALKVKTYIDMCSYSNPKDKSYVKAGIINHKHLTIDPDDKELYVKMMSGDFGYGDVNDAFMHVFGSMAKNNSQSIKEIFDILVDEQNYPVVLGCNFGLLQSSFMTLLILTVLEVSDHVIYEDYLLNNQMFNSSELMSLIKDMPEDVQDAIVDFTESDVKKLKKVFNIIRKEYGSRDEFFESLGIDDNYRARLRKVLLN